MLAVQELMQPGLGGGGQGGEVSEEPDGRNGGVWLCGERGQLGQGGLRLAGDAPQRPGRLG